MKPISVELLDIRYRRPGLSILSFSAEYEGFTRRGNIVYNTVEKKFVSHSKSLELLAAVCLCLQTQYVKRSV